MRDLKADLKFCNKAEEIFSNLKYNSFTVMQYAAESRQGWPEAIERAIKVEEWNTQLEISHVLLRAKLTQAQEEIERLKAKLAELEDLKLPDYHPGD